MLKERIEKIIAEYQLSPSRFADDIGIQRSGISHILSGRNKPSLELIQKILIRYPEISSDWLVQGNGPMKKEFIDPNQTFLFADAELEVMEVPPVMPKTDIAEELLTAMAAEKNIFKSQPQPERPSQEAKPLPQPDPVPVSASKALLNGQGSTEKKIERIVFFYTDKTFVEYRQE